jgi:ATP-dependent DNA helicase RecG
MIQFTPDAKHLTANADTRAETREKSSENGSVKTRVKTRVKILKLIQENPEITITQIAEILNLGKKGIEWQLKKLKSEKIIQRIGPARGGHWKITQPED